jgi:hypothetical protein
MLTVPVTEIELFCGPNYRVVDYGALDTAAHYYTINHVQTLFVALRRNREIEADHVGQVYV